MSPLLMYVESVSEWHGLDAMFYEKRVEVHASDRFGREFTFTVDNDGTYKPGLAIEVSWSVIA